MAHRRQPLMRAFNRPDPAVYDRHRVGLLGAGNGTRLM
jgi:hypothetical protein